jgi:hypothetical protein
VIFGAPLGRAHEKNSSGSGSNDCVFRGHHDNRIALKTNDDKSSDALRRIAFAPGQYNGQSLLLSMRPADASA